MKKLIRNYFLLTIALVFGFALVNSCTHDNELVVIDDSTFEYGSDKIANSDGYNFDKTHSSVRWETAYLGSSALLTGRFNSFSFTIDFDQDNIENSSLTGEVTLSTVNTGEPGRDAGCLLNTFAVATSDNANFVSTKIEEDNQGGYIVTGDLTFHGFTSEVVGTLDYVGTTFFDANSGVNGAPFYVAGFVVKFEMNAKSVFGIQSSSIADRVVVIASGQFKKPA